MKWLVVWLWVGMGVSVLAADAEHKVARLYYKDMAKAVATEEVTFPKYTTQIINIANQNSQATRPRNIGQLSDLIQEFDGKTYAEWEAFYTKKHPEALDEATERVWAMLEKMRAGMEQIDKPMVRAWLKDLILAKTYVGLNFQDAILQEIATRHETTWRLAKPEEEAKGIDGYIGDQPVSVKPMSYKAKAQQLQEEIKVPIIYYEKVRGGIRIEYNLD